MIFQVWKKYSKETFYTWDDHNTHKINGKTWKYDNPTTRIEYDFQINDPYTQKKTPMNPISSNSYVNNDLHC